MVRAVLIFLLTTSAWGQFFSSNARRLMNVPLCSSAATPTDGNYLKYNDSQGCWEPAAGAGGEMVYPGAGWAVSTGSAWDTSITPGAGVATFVTTPSSANLRSAMTDESGTGALLFAGGNIGAANGTSLDLTGAITAASASIGSSPPSVTAGTGGLEAMGEGTAPSAGCPAAGVDCFYADATAHAFLASYNNDTASRIARYSDALSAFGISPGTTRGDMYYLNSTPALARLAKGTQYQVLQAGANDPAYDAVHLDQAAAVTGALPGANMAAMVGDSGSGGTKGAVPAPAAGDAAAGKFLKADGTWAVASGSSYYQTLAGSSAEGSGSNNTDRTQRAKFRVRDNLTTADDGTYSIIDYNPLESRTVWIDEEYLNSNSTSGSIGTYGWVTGNIAGTNTTAASSSTWPNLGIVTITAGSSGAAQGNGLWMGLGGSGTAGTLGDLSANTNWGMMVIFSIGSTANIRLRSGAAGSSLGTFDNSSSFGIRYDTSSGFADTNFMLYVKGAAGNDVTVDTGVAADTNYHTLLVYSTTAGTWRMSLDGGTEKTFCASGGGCDGSVTLPTASMQPFHQCVTDTNTSKTCLIDAWKFHARVATGATNKRN